MNRKNQHGFTLIELLIVTTILSLLMFTGTYTYSLFTNKWQSELGGFSVSNQRTMGFYRLQVLLNNTSPYVILTDDKQPAFFFIGRADSLLAITHEGLFSQNSAEAFLLSRIKTVDGKFDLLYQAKSLADSTILTESQSIEFSQELMLAEKMDDIQFEYYGWASFQNKKGRNTNDLVGQQEWYNSYSGINKQLMPEKIKVHLTQNENKITFIIDLDANSERWLTPYFDEDSE